jgi:hypothetical protein
LLGTNPLKSLLTLGIAGAQRHPDQPIRWPRRYHEAEIWKLKPLHANTARMKIMQVGWKLMCHMRSTTGRPEELQLDSFWFPW